MYEFFIQPFHSAASFAIFQATTRNSSSLCSPLKDEVQGLIAGKEKKVSINKVIFQQSDLKWKCGNVDLYGDAHVHLHCNKEKKNIKCCNFCHAFIFFNSQLELQVQRQSVVVVVRG